MIRIGIAEDQALVRESLAIVLGLEPDLEVCWTAASGREMLERMKQCAVDVLLTDLRMPEMDGVTAIRHIRNDDTLQGKPLIMILTTFHQDEWLVDAMNAGADACFLKEIPPNLLASAIRLIYAGSGRWDPTEWDIGWRRFAPEIQFQTKVGTSYTARNGSTGDTLTARDIEVLRRISAGATNGEIAAALYLTEGTVKNYVSALYDKLGVRHRAEAVKAARERGFI